MTATTALLYCIAPKSDPSADPSRLDNTTLFLDRSGVYSCSLNVRFLSERSLRAASFEKYLQSFAVTMMRAGGGLVVASRQEPALASHAASYTGATDL